MATVMAVHSFRGGTGKSNTAANLAAIYALQGLRVGVVDTDIQSPGIHVLFGVPDKNIRFSINDYLWGKCSMEQAALDVSQALGSGAPGKIFLIPSSMNASEIARILHDGYDVNLLSSGFKELVRSLQLDVLLIDTHPGLNEETLLSIAISNALLVVMRPDQQDYEGTGLTVAVARELEVPRMLILVNKIPSAFDPEQIRQLVVRTYDCPVAAVLPHSEEMMTLASRELFVVRYPEHPITAVLRGVAELLRA